MIKDHLPAIAAAERDVDEAKTRALKVVREAQKTCPHDRVVESAAGSDTLGWRKGRRICVACGLEEVSQNFGWPGYTADGGFYEFVRTAGKRTILNTEFVKKGDVVPYRVRI